MQRRSNSVPVFKQPVIPIEFLNFLQQLFTDLTFKFYDDFDREVNEPSKVSVVRIMPVYSDNKDNDTIIGMIMAGLKVRINQQLETYGITAENFYFEKIKMNKPTNQMHDQTTALLLMKGKNSWNDIINIIKDKKPTLCNLSYNEVRHLCYFSEDNVTILDDAVAYNPELQNKTMSLREKLCEHLLGKSKTNISIVINYFDDEDILNIAVTGESVKDCGLEKFAKTITPVGGFWDDDEISFIIDISPVKKPVIHDLVSSEIAKQYQPIIQKFINLLIDELIALGELTLMLENDSISISYDQHIGHSLTEFLNDERVSYTQNEGLLLVNLKVLEERYGDTKRKRDLFELKNLPEINKLSVSQRVPWKVPFLNNKLARQLPFFSAYTENVAKISEAPNTEKNRFSNMPWENHSDSDDSNEDDFENTSNKKQKRSLRIKDLITQPMPKHIQTIQELKIQLWTKLSTYDRNIYLFDGKDDNSIDLHVASDFVGVIKRFLENINVKYQFEERADLFSFSVEGLFYALKETIELPQLIYNNSNNNNNGDNSNRSNFGFGG